MKNKLLNIGALVLAFAFIFVGIPSKVLASHGVESPIAVTGASGITALVQKGDTLYVGVSYPREIYTINTLSDTLGTTITTGGSGGIGALVLSPDGNTLYAGDSYTGTVFAISTASNTVTQTITIAACSSGCSIDALAISPDGTTLYAGGGYVYPGVAGDVYPITNLSATPAVETPIAAIPGGWVNALAMSPDGSTLFAAGYNNPSPTTAQVFPITSLSSTPVVGSAIATDAADDGNIYALAAHGNILYAGGGYPGHLATVNITTKTAGSDVATPIPASARPYFRALTVSPDGSTLYVGAEDGNIYPITNLTGTPSVGTGIASGISAGSDAIGAVAILSNGIIYAGDGNSGNVYPIKTTIAGTAIAGVTPPVAGATPVTITTATSEYTGAVTWSGSPTTFALHTVYTATITLTPKAGYTSTGVGINQFTVAGATTVTNPADSGVITAVFPATIEVSSSTAVNLGTAGHYAILSKTAITTTGVTHITGNIGVSPVTATAMTGFNQTLDSSGTFSTSTLVTGKMYAADYTSPTPSNLTTAVRDMEAAYTDATGRATDFLNTGAGNLGGLTLTPGVYTFDGAGVNIATDLHLFGNSSGVWIFQISGNIDISNAAKVLLSGGADASNIFWAVAGTTTLEAGTTFEGNILAGPATSTIAILDGVTLNGRALGQKDVTLIGDTVAVPTVPTPSTDATLSGLTISSGTLSPTFASGTFAYTTDTVPYSVANVTVTPTTNEPHASVLVNSMAPDSVIPLNVGANVIYVTVTAQDNTTQINYAITVTRAGPTSGSGGGGGSSNNYVPPVTQTPPLGCSNGNLYNTSTGALCVNNAGPEIPGCGNSNTGFSTASGVSCVGNRITSGTPNAPGASGYNFGIGTLKNGSKGAAVKELQRFLNDKLNLGLVIDGKLGPKTIAVIKKWQLAHGLVADGFVGPLTKAKMYAQ